MTTRTIDEIRADYAAAKQHGNSWANETWLLDGEGRTLLDRIEELEQSRERLRRDWQLKGLMLRFALDDLPGGSRLAYLHQALRELAAYEVVESADPIEQEERYDD